MSRMLEGIQPSGESNRTCQDALRRKTFPLSGVWQEIFTKQLSNHAYEDALGWTTLQVCIWKLILQNNWKINWYWSLNSDNLCDIIYSSYLIMFLNVD